MLKILRNLEVNVSLRLGFLGRDDDEPTSLLLDQIATDLDRGKILMPQRNVSKERDHEAISVAHRICQRDRGAWDYITFLHKLHAKIDQLHAGNDRPDGS